MKGYSFGELVKLAEAAMPRAGGAFTGNITAPKVFLSASQDMAANAAVRLDYLNSQLNASAYKEVTIESPGGLIDGKYYPIVIGGVKQATEVSVITRSSSGSSPMNSCAFYGVVQDSGWDDAGNFLAGNYNIHDSREIALDSVYRGTTNSRSVAFYVEARAFPVMVRVRGSINVYGPTESYKDVSFGESVYPGEVDRPSLNPNIGGNAITNVVLFEGAGWYQSKDVNVTQSIRTKTGTIAGQGMFQYGPQGTADNSLTRRDWVLTQLSAKANVNGQVFTGNVHVDRGSNLEPMVGVLRAGRGLRLFDNGTIQGLFSSGGGLSGLDILRREIATGDLTFGQGGALLKLLGSAARPTYNGGEIYHSNSKPTSADVGVRYEFGVSDNNYIRLAIIGYTDAQLSCILSGTGDFGGKGRDNITLVVAARRNTVEVRASSPRRSSTYGAMPKLYTRKLDNNGGFELWLRTTSYNSTQALTVLSGNGYNILRDSITGTAPSDLVEHPVYINYDTGNKPAASDVGALPVSGGTLTGNLVVNSTSVYVRAKAAETTHYWFQSSDGSERAVIYADTNKILTLRAGGGTGVTIDAEANLLAPGIITGGRLVLNARNDGGAGGVIYTEVDGGAYVNWVNRATALGLTCPASANEAYSVWKATQWDRGHIASMDVHWPSGRPPQVVLHMSGGNNNHVWEGNDYAAAGAVKANNGVWDRGHLVYSPLNVPNLDAANGIHNVLYTDAYAVGAYMLAQNLTGRTVGVGGTVAGSSLSPAAAGDRYQNGVNLPGTWRACGIAFDSGANVDNKTTLWIRIA